MLNVQLVRCLFDTLLNWFKIRAFSAFHILRNIENLQFVFFHVLILTAPI